MKILLAVDGSIFSEEAVKEVARRPWPEGSEVKVISAVEPVYVPGVEPWAPAVYFEEIEKDAGERARATVEGALSALRAREGDSLRVSSEVFLAPAKQAILQEAERWGADLIVVGSHGYGFWNRLLLGSVSQAVAAHAKCSVEIVRRREAEEGRGD